MTQIPVIQDPDWDVARSRHLGELLDIYDIDCVFDVGAHHGQFATQIREAGYSRPIVSFEPVSEHFDQLFAATRTDPDWHAYPYALGRTSAQRSMNITAGTGSSFLKPNEYAAQCWPGFASAPTKTIEIRALADVFDIVTADFRASRYFLKSATPGFDLEVFAGARDYIAQIVGIQFILSWLPLYQNMPPFEDALRTYRDAGFDVTGMFQVTTERDTLRTLEFSCVAVRATTSSAPASRVDSAGRPPRGMTTTRASGPSRAAAG